jgi:hypothetical protein
VALVNTPLQLDRCKKLEAIRLTIIEGERLNSQISLMEFDFKNIFTGFTDVRLEADIKKHFGKK